MKTDHNFLPKTDDLVLSHVTLRTGDIEKQLGFYRTVLGFTILENYDLVELHTQRRDAPLIRFKEDRTAVPRRKTSTGLFHVALRFSTRKSLALVFKRLYEVKYPFEGFADHGVSEAIYTADPDGNGVELYWDKPRDRWPYRRGELGMVTDPLDLENLTAELTIDDEWAGLEESLTVGHIHLNVSDLESAEKFYAGDLGLDVTQRSYPGALFLSVGGYHHHVAVNTWAGRRRPASEETGLQSFVMQFNETGLPGRQSMERTDPDGNIIVIKAGD